MTSVQTNPLQPDQRSTDAVRARAPGTPGEPVRAFASALWGALVVREPGRGSTGGGNGDAAEKALWGVAGEGLDGGLGSGGAGAGVAPDAAGVAVEKRTNGASVGAAPTVHGEASASLRTNAGAGELSTRGEASPLTKPSDSGLQAPDAARPGGHAGNASGGDRPLQDARPDARAGDGRGGDAPTGDGGKGSQGAPGGHGTARAHTNGAGQSADAGDGRLMQGVRAANGGAGAAVDMGARVDAARSVGAVQAASATSGGSGGGSAGARADLGIAPLSRAGESKQVFKLERPAPTPPSPPGEAQRTVTQVSRGLAQLLRSSGGTVRLSLTPVSLGTVQVRLELNGGRMTGVIEASTDRARSLLSSRVGELRAGLESRGVTVDRLEVRTSEAGSPASGPEGPGEGSDRSGAGGDGGSGAQRGVAERRGLRAALEALRSEADGGVDGATPTADEPAHGGALGVAHRGAVVRLDTTA